MFSRKHWSTAAKMKPRSDRYSMPSPHLTVSTKKPMSSYSASNRNHIKLPESFSCLAGVFIQLRIICHVLSERHITFEFLCFTALIILRFDIALCWDALKIAMTASFEEYSKKLIVQKDKPSVRNRIQELRELVAALNPMKEKRRERER